MKQKASKILAALLSVLMLFSVMPMSAFAAVDYAHNEAASSDDYYDVISKKDWDLAPGISESEVVLNNDAGDRRQVVHLMVADMNNPYTKVTTSYTNMDTNNYAVSNMMVQANWVRDNWGWNVVGAMNTCLSWYNSAVYAENPSRVNEPLGFMMIDGDVLFDHSVGFPSCLVIHKDKNDAGETRPETIAKVEMRTINTAKDLNGFEDQVIPCSSGYIVENGVNKHKAAHGSDTAPRSVVGVTADGKVVIMMNDGRQAPYSTGMNMYECAEVMIAAGCTWAVNCDGGGSSTFLSQRPGETELAVNCSPSDGALRETTSGILFISTARPDGAFNSAYITSDHDYYVANSVVNMNAAGLDFSGASADIPADVTWALSDSSFGSVENGVFTSNGTTGTVDVQMIYNDEVVGSKTLNIVHPESVSFSQASTVIPYGKTVPVEIEATYGAFEVGYSASNFEWVVSDETAGTLDLDTLTYTATNDTTKTGVVITASYKYADLGSFTLTVNYGKGSEVVWDFEDGDISNWLGIADARQWLIDNNLPVGGAFTNSNFSDDAASETFLSSAENGGQVKVGDYALGVTLDESHSQFSGWSYNMFFNVEGQTVLRDVANGKNATKLGMWVYIPEGLMVGKDLKGYAMQTMLKAGTSKETAGNFGAHLLTASGKNLASLKESDIPEDRWVYFYLDLSAYNYVSLQDPTTSTWREPTFIRFYTQHYTPKELTFYFDEIALDYSDAIDDRDAPVISDIQINTVGTDRRSFNATVKDYVASNATGLDYNTAKVYVDGVELDNVTAAGTAISSPEVSLLPGTHKVTFEICDKLSNRTKLSKTFTISGTSPVTLGGHNDLGNLPEYDSVYYVDINTNAIETIDSVVATIDLNTAHNWELEGISVAEGFTANCDYNQYANTVTVTVEKTGDCSLTGAQTLVSIPTRIWSWDAEESGISVEAQFASGLCPIVPFDAKIISGEATFVAGKNDGYLGAFGGNIHVETNLNDNINPWHVHDEVLLDMSKEATCSAAGYLGRTYCKSCGSVIDWGTTVDALGHDWKVNADGKLACNNGGELYNGVYTDGKTYVDGVVIGNGWNSDKTSYYEDGVKLTGSHLLDGVMCTFDENGTYLPDYKYDGWFEIDDTVMYFISNKYLTGYQGISGEFYLFDENGYGYDGEYEFCGTTVKFDDACVVADDTVAFAGVCGDDVQFVIYQNHSMVVDGTGPMYDYTNVSYNPWHGETDIRNNVTSLFIGKDVTTVGSRAFMDMIKLETVEFEKGSKLSVIQLCGFLRDRSLKEIVLPDKLWTIGNSSFQECTALTDVYVPASVHYLQSDAFYKSNKVTLHVAEGSIAMLRAQALGINYEIYVPEVASGACGANAEWKLYDDGTLKITGSGAMYDYNAYDSNTAPWRKYISRIEKVVIGNKITYIGKFSFYSCSQLKSVEFEAGSALETIGWGAFGACNRLTAVTIPASVKALNDYAFYNCPALKTVDFEDGSKLNAIGDYAFWNDTALTNMFIPNGVLTIKPYAFFATGNVTLSVMENSPAHTYAVNNKIAFTTRPTEAIVLESGACGANAEWEFYSDGTLKIVGTGAMNDFNAYDSNTAPWRKYISRIEKVVIGNSITYIGKFSFYSCSKLTSVEFEAGSALKTIGWGAFGACNRLTAVTIPASVKALNDYAFYNCPALKTVDFEDGSKLNAIGDYAFWNDTALTNMFIPNGVLTIKPYAFFATGNVTLSVMENSPAHTYAVNNKIAFTTRPTEAIVLESGACGANAEWEFYNDGTLKIVGTGAMDDYNAYNSNTAPWRKYASRIEKVVIGNKITYIGKFSFYICGKLTSVEFEAGSALETIGWGAFGDCKRLTAVTIPASVKALNDYAFYNCSALKTVDFEEGTKLNAIGDYAFWNDTALTAVNNIPSNTNIKKYAFFNCGYTP